MSGHDVFQTIFLKPFPYKDFTNWFTLSLISSNWLIREDQYKMYMNSNHEFLKTANYQISIRYIIYCFLTEK